MKGFRGTKAFQPKEEEIQEIKGDLVSYKVQFDFNQLTTFLNKLLKMQHETKTDLQRLTQSFTTYKEDNDLNAYKQQAEERFSEINISLENHKTKMVEMDSTILQIQDDFSEFREVTGKQHLQVTQMQRDLNQKLEINARAIQPLMAVTPNQSPRGSALVLQEATKSKFTKKMDQLDGENYEDSKERSKEQSGEQEPLSPTSPSHYESHRQYSRGDDRIYNLERRLQKEISALRAVIENKLLGLEGGIVEEEFFNNLEKRAFSDMDEEGAGDSSPIHDKVGSKFTQINTQIEELFGNSQEDEIKISKLSSNLELVQKALQTHLKINIPLLRMDTNASEEDSLPAAKVIIGDSIAGEAEAAAKALLSPMKAEVEIEEAEAEEKIEETRPSKMMAIPLDKGPSIGRHHPTSSLAPTKSYVGSRRGSRMVPAQPIQTEELDKRFAAIRKDLTRFASWEQQQTLAEKILYFENVLNGKVDKKELQDLERNARNQNKELTASVNELVQFKGFASQTISELQEGLEGGFEKIEALEQKGQMIDANVGTIDAFAQEVMEEVKSKAEQSEDILTKEKTDKIGSRLEKLCNLLEDSSGTDSSGPKASNAKVMILKLEERLENLEQKVQENMLSDLMGNYEEEKVDEKEEIHIGSTSSSVVGVGMRSADIIGFKKIIAHHTIDLSKLRDKLTEIDIFLKDLVKNMINKDYERVLESKITEASSHQRDQLESIQNKLQHKTDFEIFELFKQTIDDTIRDEFSSKIDKTDLRRTQTQLRKKINDLESKLKGSEQNQKSKGGTSLDPLPMMMYNSKCFFCNQEVKICKEVNHILHTQYSPSKYIQKEAPRPSKPSAKLGAGFSRVLNSLKSEEDLEAVFPSSTKASEEKPSLSLKTPQMRTAQTAHFSHSNLIHSQSSKASIQAYQPHSQTNIHRPTLGTTNTSFQHPHTTQQHTPNPPISARVNLSHSQDRKIYSQSVVNAVFKNNNNKQKQKEKEKEKEKDKQHQHPRLPNLKSAGNIPKKKFN